MLLHFLLFFECDNDVHYEKGYIRKLYLKYIWINIVEIEALSKYLGLTLDGFREKYLFKVGYKYSIKEVELADNSFACCFFDLEKRKCSIYDYRPTQCRTFPFWEYFKNNEKEVYKECPAIKNI